MSLREEIRAIQRELGITTIFVTHDQEEALSMSDRIVVMSAGHVEQVGAPFEVYNFPKTRFVASFVGTLNIVNATVVDPSAGRVSIDGQEIIAARGVSNTTKGDTRPLALRPEALALNRPNGQGNHLQGTIEEVNFLGAIVRVHVRFRDNAVSIDTFNSPNTPPPRRGDAATVSFAPEDVLMLEGAG